MADLKKTVTTPKAGIVTKSTTDNTLFSGDNYKWMAIGGVIIILGMVLMSGGKSENPNTFDPKVVYSFTRVTLAPILIVGGLLVELYAILRKPKPQTNA